MIVICVAGDGDVGHVRRQVQQAGTHIGFTGDDLAALAIVATELATNLVRHRTIDGEIVISRLAGESSDGIEIRSRDRGPGIADLRLALADHYSTNGTSGCGLGAVRRLVDEFDIRSSLAGEGPDRKNGASDEIGTIVTARKWIRELRQPARFVYSANSRPLPGEAANGDSYLVCEDNHGLLAAVVDGLGHGPEAARASKAAVAHIRVNKTKDFGRLVLELHEVLRGTRGAAIALARVCLRERRLVHTGTGNVVARLYPRESANLVSRPGVLGTGHAPRPRVNEMPWPQGGTLIIHSDGISARWDLAETPELLSGSVVVLGHQLMRNHSRPNDDSTVVVAREVA